jgi:hypothetical protein
MNDDLQPPGSDALRHDRLVGDSPTVRFSDAGLPEHGGVSAITGSVLPRVLRTRIILEAEHQRGATVAAASFTVDQSLTNALRTGDYLHLGRTACGGLGISIVRDGELLAAAGSVGAVPLGNVTVGVPDGFMEDLEAVLQKHGLDRPFGSFPELPTRLAWGDCTTVLFRGRGTLGDDYGFAVEHGSLPGMPGKDECVAIWRRGVAPEVGSIASAQLMDPGNALEMFTWTMDSKRRGR